MNTDHGGPDALGVPRWDFSTNANACGPCPMALTALQQADARQYPDPAYTALRERLAAFHSVPLARIVLAASASEFIGRITAALRLAGAQRVWLPALAYGDYAKAASAWGLARVSDPAQANLLWLCEPSSPLGGAEPLALQVAEQAGVVVLDRAYEPLRLTGTCSLNEAALQRVWQLWSPNKALGLTGVRGAYAIAPRHGAALAASVQALAPSWPLGAHAVAMLNTWVLPETRDWLGYSRERLREWKSLQLQQLDDFGWSVPQPGIANFFCADPFPGLAARSVTVLLQALRGHGIKLRDATSFGLPGEVRLSVLPPAAQLALAQAWLVIQPLLAEKDCCNRGPA